MKGTLKSLTAVALLATLGACSSMTTYEEQTVYKVPKWYDQCDQYTTDEWYKLFWREQNLVGCGTSIDTFGEHSTNSAILNAKSKIADRINGVVTSDASLVYDNDTKDNRLERTNRIVPSKLVEYEIIEKVVYPYQGKFVTFVKIKVPVDQVLAQNETLPN